MSVDSIEMWHRRARPNPTDKDLSIQLGCHFEEVAEMLMSFMVKDSHLSFKQGELLGALHEFANTLKKDAPEVHITYREEFLDSLADQIVTAVGVGHCAGMKTSEACDAVNSSNWSKFDENGQPLFDENGKITKGPNYHKPVLKGMY